MPPLDTILTRYAVVAYRSCKHTELTLSDGLTAIIGPNGSGKTNLLQALLLLRNTQNRWRRTDSDAFTRRCHIEADFIVNKKKVLYKATVVFTPNDENRDEILRKVEAWNFRELNKEDRWVHTEEFENNPDYIISSSGVRISQHHFLVTEQNRSRKTKSASTKEFRPLSKNVETAVRAISGFRSSIGYYSASQFTNPAACPTSFEIEEDGTLSPRNLSRTSSHTRFMFELYQMSTNKDKRYASYLSLVNNEGVGLIDGIKWDTIKFSANSYEVRSGGKVVNKKRERKLVVPTVFIGKSRLSFNQLSEGTLRTLALLFYIVTDTSNLLLIEEPEVCVHHGLLSSVIEVIKDFSRNKQIVLSTHSDMVVDSLSPEQVLLANNTKRNGTSVRPISAAMSARQFEALKKFLKTTGNLGEYWKHSGF